MMDGGAAPQWAGGADEAAEADCRREDMASPLSALRVSAPQVVRGDDGETEALLGNDAAWLSRGGGGSEKRKPPAHGWQVAATVDGLCCGVRKHRLVEVVQLRHVNYGLRWPTKRKKMAGEEDENEEAAVQRDHRNAQRRGRALDDNAPFCMVGPHWWLMAATFTVFLGAALIVTALTAPRAGVGEAVMGFALSAACLSMYAKVACSNPGIVEHLDEPLDNDYSYCDQCESFRPPGALHCMDCRVCIEDYDHHCPWTGKCIGKRNVKYFYAWLFFLVLAFVYEMIEFTTYMLPPESQPTTPFDSEDDDSFLLAERTLPSTPHGRLRAHKHTKKP